MVEGGKVEEGGSRETVKKLLLSFGSLLIATYFFPIAASLLSAIALFLSLWIVVSAPCIFRGRLVERVS